MRAWAAAVPLDFRFAVKMPRTITHELHFCDCAAELERFLDEARGLGDRLGPLLVQLPASFAYDDEVVGGFFTELRRSFAGLVVCEPCHPGWFSIAANTLLRHLRIARVAADPAPVPSAARPGGWPGLT